MLHRLMSGERLQDGGCLLAGQHRWALGLALGPRSRRDLLDSAQSPHTGSSLLRCVLMAFGEAADHEPTCESQQSKGRYGRLRPGQLYPGPLNKEVARWGGPEELSYPGSKVRPPPRPALSFIRLILSC